MRVNYVKNNIIIYKINVYFFFQFLSLRWRKNACVFWNHVWHTHHFVITVNNNPQQTTTLFSIWFWNTFYLGSKHARWTYGTGYIHTNHIGRWTRPMCICARAEHQFLSARTSSLLYLIAIIAVETHNMFTEILGRNTLCCLLQFHHRFNGTE